MIKHTGQPHVALNMATSVDGKISTVRRETVSLGSPEDRRLMDVLRARADAVVVGSGTVRLDGWAIRVRDEQLRRRRLRERSAAHPLNVVLSRRLDMKPSAEFFTHPQTDKLIITTTEATESRRRRFETLADLEVLRAQRIRPRRVVDILVQRGVRRILLEGGGELNFSFLEAGLVDEIYITVTPRILGGATAPTPVDGRGFSWRDHIRLELRSCRRRGDEVFLRYEVKHARAGER